MVGYFFTPIFLRRNFFYPEILFTQKIFYAWFIYANIFDANIFYTEILLRQIYFRQYFLHIVNIILRIYFLRQHFLRQIYLRRKFLRQITILRHNFKTKKFPFNFFCEVFYSFAIFWKSKKKWGFFQPFFANFLLFFFR